MFKFDLFPVTTLEDANRLRIFRNECRLFMTRHTGEISYDQQAKWYTDKAKEFNLPIKLEVLKANTRAFKVYEKLGFEILYEDDKCVYMEYK